MTIHLFHIVAAASVVSLAAVSPWRGELFDKRQGAFYVHYALKGFKAGKQQAAITGALSVTIVDILKKKTLVLAQDQADPAGSPRQLWKLPSGKYELTGLSLVDAAGVKRSWQPSEHKSVVVRRQSLSNLGLWTLSPAGADGLAVAVSMQENSYVEGGKRAESSLAAVVDGYTGLEQERFAGKKAKADAAADHSSRDRLRATATFTREISMFYKLDLFKFNRHAPAVANVLGASDLKMRSCYTDRLDEVPRLKGEVKFTFLLSKQTGTMAKLKRTGGTANDAKLVECMYYELAQIQFPVPENMIGELTYSFEVR